MVSIFALPDTAGCVITLVNDDTAFVANLLLSFESFVAPRPLSFCCEITIQNLCPLGTAMERLQTSLSVKCDQTTTRYAAARESSRCVRSAICNYGDRRLRG
jgi:hypothetical protein